MSPELIDDAQLAVSEVVTNAVEHAGTAITVSASMHGDGVRIAVSDRSRRLPRQRAYPLTASTGRGLRLLDGYAAAWGVEPWAVGTTRIVGKSVWFDVGLIAEPGRDTEIVQRLGAFLARCHDGRDVCRPADRVPRPSLPCVAPPRRGVLREKFLVDLDLHAVGEAVGDHADATNALVLLEEAVHGPAPASTAGQAMALAASPASHTTVELALSSEALQQFARLQVALDSAHAMSDRSELLTPPVQPEMRHLRRWVCEQVHDQSVGEAPVSWSESLRVARADELVVHSDIVWEGRDLASEQQDVLAADDRGRIVVVSPALARSIGYAPDELVGQRLLVLIPQRFRQAHLAGFTLRLLSGEGLLLGLPTVVPVLTKRGQEVDHELVLSQERAEGGRVVFLARFRLPGDDLETDPAGK